MAQMVNPAGPEVNIPKIRSLDIEFENKYAPACHFLNRGG